MKTLARIGETAQRTGHTLTYLAETGFARFIRGTETSLKFIRHTTGLDSGGEARVNRLLAESAKLVEMTSEDRQAQALLGERSGCEPTGAKCGRKRARL